MNKITTKRNLFLLTTMLLLALNLQMFSKDFNKKLSFETYVFLKKYERIKTDTANTIANTVKKNSLENYFFQSKNDVALTKIYVKVNENYSLQAVENLGCKELVKTKSVVLLSVPIDKIEELSQFDFVEWIEIATQPKPLLDRALPSSNVDKVHQGLDLERSYFGEGVIVGIIDVGFDFTHPMFSDENGNSRVKRVWMLDSSTNGNPPAGFETGTLYTDSSVIKNDVKYSSITETHGTLVAGIAVGTPMQCIKSKYSGVATKSDIAIVALEIVYSLPPLAIADSMSAQFQISSLEAFRYLFQYADSMNKPIVINYSLGYRWFEQQMDGQSLFDIAVSEILNENPQGRILVAAAGNSGDTWGDNNGYHFEIDLTSTDSAILSSTNYAQYFLQFYGEEDKDYSVELYIKNANNQAISKLITFSTEDPINFNTTPTPFFKDMIDTVITYQSDNGIDSVELVATKMTMSNVTNRASVRFSLMPKIRSDSIIFVVRGDKQIIHLWQLYNTFKSQTDNIVADGSYTIVSPGILDEVITVGAYTTKSTHYIVNDIAPFSSRGPTIDGRIKPDITAPGAEILSALNSFWFPILDDTIPNTNYGVSRSLGTSAATPMVTGIVALMLEINPKLTVNEIKDIIRITAINDQWTGDAKNNKCPTWGWGKINAHAIMKNLETNSIEDFDNTISFSVYPNPVVNNEITISIFDVVCDLPFVVRIYDQTGKLVFLSSMQNEKTFNISRLDSGFYILKIDNGKRSAVAKVVVGG